MLGDTTVYRLARLASQIACLVLQFHLFVWNRGHVSDFHVQRSWYYFSTAGTTLLVTNHLWWWGRRLLGGKPRHDGGVVALDLGWCVLWVLRLVVETLRPHSTRYPATQVAWLLGCYVARVGLLLPVAEARRACLGTRSLDPHAKVARVKAMTAVRAGVRGRHRDDEGASVDGLARLP